MSRKRALFLITSFSLVSLLITLFVAISIKSNLLQLNSLLRSDYLYSATAVGLDKPDSYYQYNAGIGFTVSGDSRTGINAEVVMQLDESDYREAVFWNADKLNVNEVAVSAGIAKEYRLEIGNHVFSKHIVGGQVHEYVVSQILPDVTRVRVQNQPTFSDGIIIMGYDPNYVENVTHNTLLFSSEDINALSDEASGSLGNIVYREDEIKQVCSDMAPYYVLMLVLSAVLMLILVAILRRTVAYNFKRLVTLGFYQKGLNKALQSLVLGIGLVSIFFSLLLSIVVFAIVGTNIMAVVLLISVVVVECITLMIGEAFIKGKLWRQ